MRLYDEDAKLNGSLPRAGDTSQDWQNRLIDALINLATSVRWTWRKWRK